MTTTLSEIEPDAKEIPEPVVRHRTNAILIATDIATRQHDVRRRLVPRELKKMTPGEALRYVPKQHSGRVTVVRKGKIKLHIGFEGTKIHLTGFIKAYGQSAANELLRRLGEQQNNQAATQPTTPSRGKTTRSHGGRTVKRGRAISRPSFRPEGIRPLPTT